MGDSMNLYESVKNNLKEAEEGNLNVNKIADFVEEAVNDLQTSDYTCSRYVLDDDLAIYVGWSEGYGDEPRDDVIQSKKNPDYGLNAGVKVRNDSDWTDFDYLNFPILADDSGDIWDSATSIRPDADYKHIAKYLIDEYKDIKKAVEKGEVLLESCKGKKKKLKESEEENTVLKTFMNKYKPLYDTKPVMKGDTLYADQVSFRGSGIPKRVEAELRPDNTMEVGNEEWGFKYDGSAIDENSMENMSQYWFYDDYRSNEDTKAKIDKATKSLYDDMVKLRDSMSGSLNEKENLKESENYPKLESELMGVVADYLSGIEGVSNISTYEDMELNRVCKYTYDGNTFVVRVDEIN